MSFPPMASGLGSVGAYQMSGVPFLSSSIAATSSSVNEIHFPSVTKFVTVRCDSGSLDVAFSEAGFDTNNYFTLNTSESFSGDWRVVRLYLSSASDGVATIVAGLTSVKASDLPQNWSGSVGIG